MNPNARTLLRPAAIGTGLALVGVAAVYLVAQAAGAPLTVATGGSTEEIPLLAALGFTLLGGAAGYGLALLARRFGRPRTVFLTVVVAALVLYGVPPFVAADSTSTAVWLNLMHLVAAAAIVPALARPLPATRTPAATSARPGVGTR
ncbi:MAG TPA: DUF6069 family protein [Pseudonocardia sp.]|nr:DUF6069 family protein [Pseudonocardia sp.]